MKNIWKKKSSQVVMKKKKKKTTKQQSNSSHEYSMQFPLICSLSLSPCLRVDDKDHKRDMMNKTRKHEVGLA